MQHDHISKVCIKNMQSFNILQNMHMTTVCEPRHKQTQSTRYAIDFLILSLEKVYNKKCM